MDRVRLTRSYGANLIRSPICSCNISQMFLPSMYFNVNNTRLTKHIISSFPPNVKMRKSSVAESVDLTTLQRCFSSS